MSWAITVPHSVLVNDGAGNYVVYRIEVRAICNNELVAGCYRRYKQFEQLNRSLRKAGLPVVRLPGKSLGNVNTEERRVRLQASLQQYVGGRRTLPRELSDWLELTTGTLDTRHRAGQRGHVMPFSHLVSTGAVLDLKDTHIRGIIDMVRSESQLAANGGGCVSAFSCVNFARAMAVFSIGLIIPATLAGLLNLSGQNASAFAGGLSLGFILCTAVWVFAFQQPAGKPAMATESKAPHSVSDAILIDRVRDVLRKTWAESVDGFTGSFTGSFSGSSFDTTSFGPSEGDSLYPIGEDGEQPAPEAVPPLVKQKNETAFQMLALNLRDDLNCLDQKWERKSFKDGVAIWASAIPGSSRKVWKSVCKVRVKGGMEEVINGKSLELSYSATQPAGGGAVSSREFYDIRDVRHLEEQEGFLSVAVSLTHDEMPALVPKPGGGTVRGMMHEGCGMRAIRIEPGEGESLQPGETLWLCETVANIDLKGWVPAGAIVVAMTGALTDTSKCMMKHFESS
eukprot:TRINITY_DN16174_c0_g1_i3.p1 TRINITY_DN16174_c0_g1~~TRINITY_DN16174_c0_g1_i3.p1  ORF type:complete len:510 (-),score=55.74 TRINITY_DN16174_c0_g1_i3:202-1731(-)